MYNNYIIATFSGSKHTNPDIVQCRNNRSRHEPIIAVHSEYLTKHLDLVQIVTTKIQRTMWFHVKRYYFSKMTFN